MRRDSTPRQACKTTGVATGLLLAACLALTPGCGTEAPKPVASLAMFSFETPTTPQVKAKGKGNVERYDDLKERRARRRLAAQGTR